MDLRRRLAAAAVRRASVLVVEVPGWSATRMAVERGARERGWQQALSPADADALVTCGVPGDRLAAAIDLVWEQLPGPRARVRATGPSGAGPALDEAAAALLDDDGQRRDAAGRSTEPVMGTGAHDQDSDDRSGDEAPATGQEGQDGSGDTDHGDTDHGDTDHGDTDHGDTDHGDMDMPMPGGIPLAGEGGDERDDLALDVLHVPLGPVLPHWPAGLLLHCTLHGDVLGDVRGEVLRAAGDAVPDLDPGAAADRLDRASRVLALAGWDGPATAATRIRDDAHAGADPSSCLRSVERLTDRVRRSRVLRWSLRGVGRIDREACRQLGLDGRLAGDAYDRLLDVLADARSALAGEPVADCPVPLDVLPGLLTGAEVGAVRLVVAGLDLDARASRPAAAGAA